MDIATLDRSVEDIDLMCRIVRAAPPERFVMHDFYTQTACGTAACVAGWCALDLDFAQRLGLGESKYAASDLCIVAVPALREAPEYGFVRSPHRDHRVEIAAPLGFLYAATGDIRASRVDDTPFAPTPAENVALGEDYARGLAEREAALNRLAIVRACLVKWRSALPQLARQQAPVGVAVHA